MPRACQAVETTFHSCRRPPGWRGLAALSGYGPRGSEAQGLPGCPEGNWDLGQTFWFQLGGLGGAHGAAGAGGRVESKRRQAGDSWGLPSPGPGTRWPDPSLRAPAPRLGLRSDAPRPGLGWEHAGTHAHTSPQPQSLRAAVVLDRKALFLLMK